MSFEKQYKELMEMVNLQGTSVKDYDKSTVRKGAAVEKEHTNSLKKAKKIAVQHMAEFPEESKDKSDDDKIDSKYYKELERLEKRLDKKKEPLIKVKKEITEMAKLSARGRSEVKRWAFSKDADQNPDEQITHERVDVALMSDGNILRKRTVWFKPSQFDPNGRKHDWGWKLHVKLNPSPITPELVQKVEDFYYKKYLAKGYQPVLKENTSVGGVYGDVASFGGAVGNTDFYATGDARTPTSIFGSKKAAKIQAGKKGKKEKKVFNSSPAVMKRTFVKGY